MAYRLNPHKGVRNELRRVARNQVDDVLTLLAAPDAPPQPPHDLVHEVRTTCKKLRGLLRLIEPALGGRFRREDTRLRDLSRSLSQLRDAEVLVQTFDRLFDHFDGEVSSDVRRVRMKLQTRLRAMVERHDLPARLAAAGQSLERLRADVDAWTPRRRGWRALEGGLTTTYRRARHAMDTAYSRAGNHHFHEWRKHLKYHGYHGRLLAAVWVEEMEMRQAAIDHLGELLGLDQDLTVFAATLHDEPNCFDNEQDKAQLLTLVARRRREVRAEARPIGLRLFAERPKDFRRRLAAYHQVSRADRGGVRGRVFSSSAPKQPAVQRS